MPPSLYLSTNKPVFSPYSVFGPVAQVAAIVAEVKEAEESYCLAFIASSQQFIGGCR